jgi:ABC-type antimicrobial peptide transport system permease subunit
VTEPRTPYVYYPYLQRPEHTMILHARTELDPSRVIPALRRELAELAPHGLAPEVTTLRERVAGATMPRRIAAISLGALGVLTLIVATIGLYGLVAFAVAQRTREFGIRIALGAMASDLRGSVVRDGLCLATSGLILGIVISLALSWLARSFLLVSPFDPLAFVSVSLLLAAAAALASYLPARRATRVDPLAALRSE